MRHFYLRGGDRRGFSVVTLFGAMLLFGCSAAASAAVTTWIAPTGGSWHDRANWSAGVPTTGDVAVLPTLVSGAYEISVASDSSFASLVVSGTVTLVGQGTITASDGTDIGVGASTHGSLTLAGADLHAGVVLRVGADGGVGELALKGPSSDVVANLALVGMTGSATVSIEPSNLFTAGFGSFGATSALKVLVAPAMQPVLAGAQLTVAGELEVTLTPELTLPILAGIPLATQTTLISGAFSTITSPEAYGQFVPVKLIGLVVGPFDPIVSTTIALGAPAAYLGFAVPLSASAVRLSGATPVVCCTYSTASATSWSVDPASLASVEESGVARKLRGLAPGDVTVTLSYPQYGAMITATKVASVLANTGPVIDIVDVGPNGEPPDGTVWGGYGDSGVATTVRCSATGRFVVFADDATTFAPFDPSPDLPDVFVKDRLNGAIEMVSAAALSPGVPAACGDVDISADGRWVTFAAFPWPSSSGIAQLWLYDRQSATTTLVSRATSGAPGNGHSWQGRISGDGAVVVFASEANDLVADDTNGTSDVFAYHIASGALTLVSVAPDGRQLAGHSSQPAVSGDGRVVAFQTIGDFGSGNAQQIVVKDRMTGAIELVSMSSGGTPGNLMSTAPNIDESGQIVAFRTRAMNFGASTSAWKICVRDRATDTTTVAYSPSPGPWWADFCASGVQNPCISADGRFIAFETYKPADDVSTQYLSCSIARYDRSTGQTELVAVTPWNTAVPGYITSPALSADGNTAFFIANPATMLPFGEDVESRLFARTFGAANSPDLDDDGLVGPSDLGILLGAWGSPGPGDLDADGIVGPTDIAVLLGSWS